MDSISLLEVRDCHTSKECIIHPAWNLTQVSRRYAFNHGRMIANSLTVGLTFSRGAKILCRSRPLISCASSRGTVCGFPLTKNVTGKYGDHWSGSICNRDRDSDQCFKNLDVCHPGLWLRQGIFPDGLFLHRQPKLASQQTAVENLNAL